jgi:hypothetical protein
LKKKTAAINDRGCFLFHHDRDFKWRGNPSVSTLSPLAANKVLLGVQIAASGSE